MFEVKCIIFYAFGLYYNGQVGACNSSGRVNVRPYDC